MTADASSTRRPPARMKAFAMAAPAALALALVAGCSSSPTSDPESGAVALTAYITDSMDNGKSPGVGTVIPVNLADGTPGTPIALGPASGTNDIIVTADGATAYVSNEGTDSVTPITLATGQTGTSIAVGKEPVDVKFVPQSGEKMAWTANYGGQTVSIIDLSTGEPGQTLTMPDAGPNTVAFTPDGRLCYVANWGTDDKAGDTVTPVEVLDGGAGGRILPSITVGKNPNWIAITEDGKTAYVANKGSNSLTPIDVATNTAGAEIAMPGPPIQMEISPDGTVAYVAIAGTSPNIDAVVPIDLTATPVSVGSPIALVPGAQPHWIAFTPDGQTAYVVGNGNSTLTPITVSSGATGTPITVSTNPDSDILAISIVRTP